MYGAAVAVDDAAFVDFDLLDVPDVRRVPAIHLVAAPPDQPTADDLAVPGLPVRVPIAGVGFDPLSERAVIDHILGSLDAGVGGWVVTPNVDVLRMIVRRPEVGALAERASLVVADGAPVEWASRLTGRPLPERVCGSVLVWSLSTAAAECARTVFLLGGAPGTAERAGERLKAAVPDLKLVGTHCPPFGFESDPQAFDAIVQALDYASPDIVFVGLGTPKQEILIDELRHRYPATWFLGIGAGLTFAAGDVDRAPRWMQRAGGEWVFRLVKEPRRLARRYLMDDIPFAVWLLSVAMLEGRRARRAG